MTTTPSLPASIANLVKPTVYLSCAETAKLIRKALKEAFPEVKFSVRSSVYAGGASINVGWTMGPLREQVETVAKRFQGARFDGMTDMKSYVTHVEDGQTVSFGADYVFCNRELDAAKLDALADIFKRADRADWLTLAGRYGLAQEALRWLEYRSEPREFARNMLQALPAPDFADRRSAKADAVSVLRGD